MYIHSYHKIKSKELLAGIYIHIPFCKQACHYCDFHFSTQLDNRQLMVDALSRELALRESYVQAPIQTIYFGGGTPSLLSSAELNEILESAHVHFDTSQVSEITLEANPEDLTAQKLLKFRDLGINRLSIGVQSFNDQILSFFNRSHDAQMAIDGLTLANKYGFENITADLIFGIPGQTLDQLRADLDQLMAFDIPHVSIYGMTIEENTVFGSWLKKGQLKPLEEENAAEQYEWIMNALEKFGYEQYEISNFAKPGYQSMHNSSYWSGAHYVGIGPSAHSFDGHSRQYNVRNNVKYTKSILQGSVPYEHEKLSRTNAINEAILIQIRLKKGINLSDLSNRLGFDLLTERSKEVRNWQKSKHITLTDSHLSLTKTGKLIADYITEHLVIT